MNSPSRSSTLGARLSAYRPVLDRLIFGVALLGLLTTVHLGIQQGRGFDRGCLGFSAPTATEATFDCSVVTESRAGTLLGISNVAWGIGFYFVVAGLTAAAAFTKSAQRRTIKATRAALLAGGLGYSAYLTVHQFTGLGALCALCLASAAIATILFILQAVALSRPVPEPAPAEETPASASSSTPSSTQRPTPVSFSNRKRDVALFSSLALALLVLVGADLAYFNSLETPARSHAATPTTEASETAPTGPERSQPAETTRPSSASTMPASSAADTTESLPAGCRLEEGGPAAQNPNQLVSFVDLVEGDASAPVTVVEFFALNCPHCKTFYPTMEDLLDQYGDQVRFAYKPIPLRAQYIKQIEAVYAAAQEGKFKAMIDEQFARQKPGGLSMEELKSIAREIGIDPGTMASRIEQDTYMQRVAQQQRQARQFGVRSVPTVLINGRLVPRTSRKKACLTALVERAIDGG